MSAHAGHAALVQHNDLFRGKDGAHTLRHHDDGGILQLVFYGKPQRRVCLEIQRGKAVVKDIYFRPADQRPRDGDALLLPAGKIGAALADVGIQSLRQRPHEVRRLRQLQRVPYLFVGGVLLAEADVFPHGAAEKRRRLGDIADQRKQRLRVQLLHVHAVHLHTALRHVVQPGDQVDEGGFAAAGAADDSGGLPGQRRKGHVLQHRFLRAGVGKGNVVERYRAALGGVGSRGRFRGQYLRLQIQHLQNALGGDVGAGHDDEHGARHDEGGDDHDHIDDKRLQVADGVGDLRRLQRRVHGVDIMRGG